MSFPKCGKSLTRRPCIIISNHPGYIDVPAILRCIERDDIMIMVDRAGYGTLRDLIGEKYIVPADTAALSKVASHIQNGGVFLIFPTGGDGGGDAIDFRPGFTKLLQGLRPEDMVYSFYMDQQDVEEIESTYRGRVAGVASALYLTPALSLNRLHETKTFSVDEHYSSAREWQDACSAGSSTKSRTALLTKHYKNLYGV
jgi:hypothetical protein